MGIIIDKNTKLIIEDSALSGVRKVAERVADDMKKVFTGNNVVTGTEYADDNSVYVATIGYSEIAKSLDLSDIEGKREVYKFAKINGRLAIIGSDKRGTIYGLFHLSELMGVSCLVDWFKVMPPKKESLEITDDDFITSKEPSVRFRGLFINDEWPAFGNWCTKNFGGFNAKAYEEIFYLLLRMKGNYMWPAMWSAIFPDDGPGLLNEELADELGVVMGMSHHEPCLRQGEEYRYVRGKDSIYGDAWNFRSNEAGITKFWEDGLKRSGKFENVITVGMRGEADTAIMGKDATLKDNIDLLRDVLKTQNRLIRENVCEDLDSVPRMLALYKEVEPYFYGDENTKGLMGDPELDGVTLMLCDDNYGNLRTVPTEEMRKHRGGYGMYYHFDYHGFPISFEWVNSSYLPKVWEQMTTAYEMGIRDLWIVNVGDLFTMEYPLSYFLELAYDYDKWGVKNLNSGFEYTEKFVKQVFGTNVSEETGEDMQRLLTGYTKIAHSRRPEAMNVDVYHPFNYKETADLLEKIDDLEKLADKISEDVFEELKYPVFELMYYPARANLNVQKLWLYTGLNNGYAKFADTRANGYAKKIEECLEYDVEIVDKLHTIDNGRWYGMGLSEHIGFRNWCEEECRYPVVNTFKPGNKARVIVSVPGTSQHSEGGVWTGKELTLGDFLVPGVNKAQIELSLGGTRGEYEIESSQDYIVVSDTKGSLCAEGSKLIDITYDREKYNGTPAYITVKSDAGTTKINIPVCEKTIDDIKKDYSEGTYIWCGQEEINPKSYNPYQYVSIEAAGFTSISEGKSADGPAIFKIIPEYGKTVSAVKAFPINEVYNEETAPSVSYTFEVKRDGNYVVECYMNPSNAPFMDGHLYYGVRAGNGDMTKADALPEGFKVGDGQPDWSKGVLDNIRVSANTFSLKKGINEVTFSCLSPGFVLEKIVIYEEGLKPLESYLGPSETYRV